VQAVNDLPTVSRPYRAKIGSNAAAEWLREHPGLRQKADP
jgi:hypothetical protein